MIILDLNRLSSEIEAWLRAQQALSDAAEDAAAPPSNDRTAPAPGRNEPVGPGVPDSNSHHPLDQHVSTLITGRDVDVNSQKQKGAGWGILGVNIHISSSCQGGETLPKWMGWQGRMGTGPTRSWESSGEIRTGKEHCWGQMFSASPQHLLACRTGWRPYRRPPPCVASLCGCARGTLPSTGAAPSTGSSLRPFASMVSEPAPLRRPAVHSILPLKPRRETFRKELSGLQTGMGCGGEGGLVPQ